MTKQEGKRPIEENKFGDFDKNISLEEISIMEEAIQEEQVELKIPEVKKIEKHDIPEEDENIEAVYPYRNLENKILYEIIRKKGRGEKFLIRHKDESGKYAYKRPKDVELVAYNLPDVRNAIEINKPIWITEGESKADTLKRLGFTSTTCAFSGSKKWYSFYNSYIEDAQTILMLIDNDEASEEFAELTTQTILSQNADISIYPIRINEICSNLKIGADIDDLIDRAGEDNVKVTLETIESTYA